MEARTVHELARHNRADWRDAKELEPIYDSGRTDPSTARRRDELERARLDRLEFCEILQRERMERLNRDDSAHRDRVPSIRDDMKSIVRRRQDIARRQQDRKQALIELARREHLPDDRESIRQADRVTRWDFPTRVPGRDDRSAPGRGFGRGF